MSTPVGDVLQRNPLDAMAVHSAAEQSGWWIAPHHPAHPLGSVHGGLAGRGLETLEAVSHSGRMGCVRPAGSSSTPVVGYDPDGRLHALYQLLAYVVRTGTCHHHGGDAAVLNPILEQRVIHALLEGRHPLRTDRIAPMQTAPILWYWPSTRPISGRRCRRPCSRGGWSNPRIWWSSCGSAVSFRDATYSTAPSDIDSGTRGGTPCSRIFRGSCTSCAHRRLGSSDEEGGVSRAYRRMPIWT